MTLSLLATAVVTVSCDSARVVDPESRPDLDSHVENTAPVADAGPDRVVYAGMRVTFDASASTDADGDSLSYIWYFNGDATPDAYGPQAVRHFRAPGPAFRTRLRVVDVHGGTDVDTVFTEVRPNTRPLAVLKVNGIERADGDTIRGLYEGSQIRFDSEGSHDPDGTPVTVQWFFGDGTTSTLARPTKMYSDNGRRVVRLIVRDASNAPDTTRVVLAITSQVPAATFIMPANVVYEGSTYRLRVADAWDRSPADLAAGFTYAFDCGAGFSPFTTTASILCPARVDQGTVRIRMRVRDKDGATRNFTGSLGVQNARPRVTILSAPDTIPAGGTYHLDWSFTDRGIADGPWQWDVVPASNVTGTTMSSHGSHTFTRVFRNPGTFTVRVRVIDKDGLAGIVRRTVVVTP